MITRLEVDGFKSLRDFAVDLEPFTVFIGPNSAGKSNVLDALALLSRLASMSVEEAFKHGRGRALDQFTRRGGEAGETIRFAVEVSRASSLGEEQRLRYELAVVRRVEPSGTERLELTGESLQRSDRKSPGWTSVPLVALLTVDRRAAITFYEPTVRARDGHGEEPFIVADELRRCRLFRVDSAHLRDPSERL